ICCRVTSVSFRLLLMDDLQPYRFAATCYRRRTGSRAVPAARITDVGPVHLALSHMTIAGFSRRRIYIVVRPRLLFLAYQLFFEGDVGLGTALHGLRPQRLDEGDELVERQAFADRHRLGTRT